MSGNRNNFLPAALAYHPGFARVFRADRFDTRVRRTAGGLSRSS